MGWTYTHKDSSVGIKEFFKQEFEFQNERRKLTVLDCAVVNLREAYLALEELNKASGKREVFAVVCLLDYKPNDYYNFGYKDMEESMGPYCYNCPERILDLLTPTSNELALKWRKKCSDRTEKTKAISKVKEGDILEFEKAVPFSDGSKHLKLELADGKKLLFKAPEGGGYYKLTRRFLISTPFRVIRR